MDEQESFPLTSEEEAHDHGGPRHARRRAGGQACEDDAAELGAERPVPHRAKHGEEGGDEREGEAEEPGVGGALPVQGHGVLDGEDRADALERRDEVAEGQGQLARVPDPEGGGVEEVLVRGGGLGGGKKAWWMLAARTARKPRRRALGSWGDGEACQ